MTPKERFALMQKQHPIDPTIGGLFKERKPKRSVTGDSLLDKGLCPLCGSRMIIKQEAYTTVYTCRIGGCAINKITVDCS